MTLRQKKISIILTTLFGVICVSALVLYALEKNIDLYYTPTQAIENALSKNQHFRLGGLVKKNSVHYGKSISFVLTDTVHEVTVHYEGILPDLFKEGQGIVAEGHFNNQRIFIANEVLAKHDENYMPLPLKNRGKSE